MFAVEMLRSELHRDGLVHARVPSAALTLCGRDGTGGDGVATPSCSRCSEVAAVWDRIDGSMPVAWRYTT